MIKLNLLILSLGLVLFSGCSSTAPSIPKVKQIPAWYNKHKPTTAKYIYAVASGTTKEEAILNALNEIVSQFSISIESNIETNTNTTSGKNKSYSKEINKNIKSKVAEVKINNYKLLNTYRMKYNEFLVQVEVDKFKLQEFLQNMLTINFKNLAIEEKSFKDENYLDKSSGYKKIYYDALSNISLINVISSIDDLFNDKKYHQIINKYKKNYLYFENNLNIYVKSNNNEKLFTNRLKSLLTEKKIKIVESKIDKNVLTVTTEIKEHSVKTNYINMIVFTININLYANNQQIGNNTIEIKEYNKGKISRIRQKASERFLLELQELSIEDIFKIKL